MDVLLHSRTLIAICQGGSRPGAEVSWNLRHHAGQVSSL